jgi:hypothetical protein
MRYYHYLGLAFLVLAILLVATPASCIVNGVSHLRGAEASKAVLPSVSVPDEASSSKYELVEMWLEKYPYDLLEAVEKAYEDDVLTVPEFKVIEVVKERIDLQKAKARTKSRLKEIRDGRNAEKQAGRVAD